MLERGSEEPFRAEGEEEGDFAEDRPRGSQGFRIKGGGGGRWGLKRECTGWFGVWEPGEVPGELDFLW